MAFNPSFDDGKRAVVNPKNLRFTQPDIRSTFKDATYPSVRDTASLLQNGQLNRSAFGELIAHKDEKGVMWCENNRRLFVLREADAPSVPVKFKGNDYMSRRLKEEVKSKLDNPTFMPKIRGETSEVQSRLSPTPGPNVYQERKETSLLGVVGSVSAALVAGYWGWKLYNTQQENDDDGNEN